MAQLQAIIRKENNKLVYVKEEKTFVHTTHGGCYSSFSIELMQLGLMHVYGFPIIYPHTMEP